MFHFHGYKILYNASEGAHIWASSCDMRIWALSWENRLFAYAKTKTQISFAVTAKLISAFVFATQIVQSLYLLNPKFQASSHLLWLYSHLCRTWSETMKTSFLTMRLIKQISCSTQLNMTGRSSLGHQCRLGCKQGWDRSLRPAQSFVKICHEDILWPYSSSSADSRRAVVC